MSMLVLIGMCTTGVISVLSNAFEKTQMEELQAQADFIATILETENIDNMAVIDPHNFRLDIISPEGKVIYDSSGQPDRLGSHLDRPEIAQAREQGYGQAVRHSKTLGVQSEYAARRLHDGSFVRLSVAHSSALGLFGQSALPLLAVLLAAVLLALWLSRVLTSLIVSPINNIDLDHPQANKTYEQLQPLIRRLEDNRQQIQAQMKELSRKKEEFDLISSNMDEGLMVLSRENTLISCNQAAARLFHVNKDWKAQDSSEVWQALEQAEKDGRARLYFKQNGKRYVLEAASMRHKGHYSGAVVLVMDITEKQEAQKRRREFASNVTHEMKTPLQTILSSSELLENGLVQPADVPRFASYIHKEASHLSELVGDILHLSRLDDHEERQKEWVQTDEVVRKILEDVHTIADVRHIVLHQDLMSVRCYFPQGVFDEAASNLIENAIRYGREGGNVWVDLYRKYDDLIFEVKDDGIGIPESEQERIFERFYRVEKSHSRALGGSGLGLAIVKHSVEILGGRIELQSAPGKGTLMRLIIPLSEEAAANAENEQAGSR